MTVVREAVDADIPRLVQLRTQLYTADNVYYGDVISNWPGSQEGEEDLREYITRPNQLCLVVEEDELVTGFLLGVVKGRSAAMRGRRAELDEIFVHKEGRRTGKGSQMLRKFTDWWHDQGADAALVSIFEPNTVSQDFFIANGYGPYIVRLMQMSGRQREKLSA